MKSATRVTSRGQVVIPKPVREQLRWVPGTQLAVEVMDGGAVRLTLLEPENAIDTLYGCLKDLPQDPLSDLEAEHRAEIAADERWQRRGRCPLGCLSPDPPVPRGARHVRAKAPKS